MILDIYSLARNIKKYRTLQGLKQYELAEKLNVSSQAISKWETGSSVPDVENICMLSRIFGVSIDELLNNKYQKDKFMIAVDGGGTKTEFVLFTEKGSIKQRMLLDGCNPNICGIDKTCEILRLGIDSLKLPDNKIFGIYCGLAGFSSGNNGVKIGNFLNEAYPDICIGCGSDILNVAASAGVQNKCISVICGTGANISAIKGNKINRIGGWGYLFEGAGSGYDIGRDAITAALAETDGIGPETLITKLVESELGGKVWENINALYSADKSYIASFSKVVFEAYEQGDEVAKEIITTNMNALTEKINFAAENFDCGKTIVISGGLMSQKDILLKFIKRNLRKNLSIVVPSLPQIFGACILCCDECGEKIENFEEIFTQEYEKYTAGGNLDA